MIEDFFEVAEDGSLLSPDWHTKNEGANFKILPVIGAQWKFNGKTVRKIYHYNNGPEILPDSDGVIVIEKSDDNKQTRDELVVYEPDGSERFRIKAPKANKETNESDCYFYYSRYLLDKNQWECLFYDGNGDKIATLDIKTGGLKDFRETRV